MPRWEGNAQERLEAAALELFAARGFEATTVSDIADRAGLTPRTFYRYYADKREILGPDDGSALERACVTALAGAAADHGPVDLMAAALDAAAAVLSASGGRGLRRYAIVVGNAGLRERELLRQDDLARALAGALRERGVVEPSASLIAEVGLALLRVSLARWATDPNGPGLSELVRDSLFQLADLVDSA